MKCPHCNKEVFGRGHNVANLYEEPKTKVFEDWWKKHKWDRPFHHDAAKDAWKAALEWALSQHGGDWDTEKIEEELGDFDE